MKLKLKILGPKVHDVGYRPFLIALADDFDIQRFSVRNTTEDSRQVVIVKVDADEDQLNDFIEAVQSRRPKKAEVLDIQHEPFEGRVPSIVKTSLLNMNAQLAKGIAAIETMVDKQDQALGKMDQMLEKQDSMLEKQDSMLKRQDGMLERQDETVEEIRGLRGDLNQNTNRRLAEIEKDMQIVKAKLRIR